MFIQQNLLKLGQKSKSVWHLNHGSLHTRPAQHDGCSAEVRLRRSFLSAPHPGKVPTSHQVRLPTFITRSKSICWSVATGEEQKAITNSSQKNEAAGPKQKQCSDGDVSGGESKVWWYKEQYCIGTWKVRSMNQGKLGVVKQEMARVNINILGISELKWMGMGKFNSYKHYIYYCGQESLRRNRVAL